jgi:4-hydroxybenzoate polyprenyltransferase
MQPTAGEEFRRVRRRSSIALAVGIVLIAGAVLLSINRLASDVLTTVAGIAGVLAICYGLVTQVTVLLNNREPDE